MTWWFLLFACRTADVVDACKSDESLCFTCTSDAECGYTGNSCTERVYCAHDDATISVVQLGCAEQVEYGWPPDETCQCLEGVCAYTD